MLIGGYGIYTYITSEFVLPDLSPLSPEMLEYARLDTHYLLPMYYLMKRDLIAKSNFNVDPVMCKYMKFAFLIFIYIFRQYTIQQ